MSKTSADKVADYLINATAKHGDLLTNLKLQKLLYYAQAWHLALYHEPLFDEKFQAWVHGPVIPSLYRKYRNYKYSAISDIPNEPDLPPEVIEHLEQILESFNELSAWQLEKMTHMETPWLNARKGLTSDELSDNEISEIDMEQFYSLLLKSSSDGEVK